MIPKGASDGMFRKHCDAGISVESTVVVHLRRAPVDDSGLS